MSFIVLFDAEWEHEGIISWVFCSRLTHNTDAGDLFHNDSDRAFDQFGLLILFCFFNLATTCWTCLGFDIGVHALTIFACLVLKLFHG